MNAKTWSIACMVVLGVAAAFAEETSSLGLVLAGGHAAVTIPAGALDDTSKLYIVWDDADQGENLVDWPDANRIEYAGTLSAGAATCSIDISGVPSGKTLRAIATHEIRLTSGWVKLGADQYIDTGAFGIATFGVEFRFRPTGTFSGNWASVIGSKLDNFTVGMRDNSSFNYYLRYRTGEIGNPLFLLGDISVPHTIRIAEGRCLLDGEEVRSGLSTSAIGSDSSAIFLGSSNNGSGASSGRYCHSEWYFARFYNNVGEVCAEFVPALRGNTSSPEVVFYETVSGTCYTNAGTGGALVGDAGAVVTNSISKLAAFSMPMTLGMTAWWTGRGDLSNVNDPANWACTNSVGAEVAGAVPDEETVVMVKGAVNFNMPVGQTLKCREMHIDDCTLTADCDWRGLDSVRFPVRVLQHLDAAHRSYVDTGFKPNQDTRVVMEVTVTMPTEYWFGAWNKDWDNEAYAVCNDSRGVYIAYGSGDNCGTVAPIIPNGRHVLEFSNGVFSCDGEVHTERAAATFQVDYNLYLFAQNRKGTATAGAGSDQMAIRFHSCQIYDGETLVRDYVPVLNGTEACLYDRCTRQFAHNATGISFTAGPPTNETIEGETYPTFVSGTVDLAGHSLAIGALDGVGAITDGTGGGELHTAPGEGVTVRNTGVAYTGALKLVKEGAGTFVAMKMGQTYTGGTVVKAGVAKSGATDGAWGPARAFITVEEGAAFDWGGMVDNATTTPYNFNLAGFGPDGVGAMYSSLDTVGGEVWNRNYIADLELAGDTLITSPCGNWSMLGLRYRNNASTPHLITMNGYKLSVMPGDRFAFSPVKTVGQGTIEVLPNEASVETRQISFYGEASDLSSVTFDVHDGCGINAEMPIRVGVFIDRRETVWRKSVETDAGLMTVLERYSPSSTNLLKTICLGDAEHLAPVFDLRAVPGTFMVPETGYALSAADGAVVEVNLAGRKDLKSIAESGNPYVVRWPAEPEGFRCALDARTSRFGFVLHQESAGLRLVYNGGSVMLLR